MKSSAKYFLVLLVIIALINKTFAQRDIEPELVFSDTVNFNFSGEWQYLSTDIYLFNGELFSTLINELDFVRQGKEYTGSIFRRKSKLTEEYLEYLFITVNLKNVKFFGDNDITYPLYNFQISKDEDQKYRTFVSDNIEYVRLIDNLPLYSASDFIDAEIRVRAITNNDRDQILDLVASQLKGLSKIQTPTSALMGIIGEFGNFIESNTKKKEYRFSSTIRLFEQKNFDTRLHSIRVYALTTSNSKPILVDVGPLSALLDTSSNPQVNRKVLAELINYQTYPLIVVANYKSLYRMEQVTGDEVNFASIEKRKLKIENDYKLGLINAETYRQERDFINFITIFANLKNHLEVYSLNYRTGNTDAIAGGLFKLTQYYRQLIKANDEIKFKYRGNSTYQTVFKKEYESIMGYASLYLSEDHNLKGVKELGQILVKIESQVQFQSVQEIERVVELLHFADIFKPHHTDQTIEGQTIKINIEKFEKELYSEFFEAEVKKLNKIQPEKNNKNITDTLRHMLRSTACGFCKDEGFRAINDFNERYQEFERQQAIINRDSIVSALQPWIFGELQLIQRARENLELLYGSEKQSETRSYITEKIAEAERDIKNLQDFSRIDVSDRELSMVENLNLKLISTRSNAEKTLSFVCGLNSELCGKMREGDALARESETNRLTSSFADEDLAVRQNNIFIAIFEYQLSAISAKIAELENTALQEKVTKGESIIKQLKAANELYTVSLSDRKKLVPLQQEINSLLREISDLLSELEGKVN